MALRSGERFGRYEVASLLGRGGMGEVYRARDTLLRRTVALKMLSPTADGDREEPTTAGEARMLREARAAAAIAHPNAVAIYDLGQLDGVTFLAMEFVSGRTLRAYVGDTTVPLAKRIRWVTDVARALGAAHTLGVVHRDVKPENVMVSDDGVVKVLDFGIARRTERTGADSGAPVVDAGPGTSTITVKRESVGTPAYMAPEQMRGDPIDGRADQFAWGVVAYELLTGSVPWQGERGDARLVAKSLTSALTSPREKNPEIPAMVDAAIRVALSHSPGDRHANMDDLAEALEPFASRDVSAGGTLSERPSDVPVAPTDPAPPTRLATTPDAGGGRRAPSLAAGVVALALAALAVIVGARVVAARRTAKGPTATSSPHEVESTLSANAEANAEYRAGMRALRDVSVAPAVVHFNRSLELDPGFAAAHLGRALFETVSDGPNLSDLQKHLARARSGRGLLGDRDAALLDALEPCASEPPDLKESARRLEDAARKYPDDADYLFELGLFRRSLRDHTGAAAALEGSLARDPTYATAWRMIARERLAVDDAPGALVADEQCLKVSPAGIACLVDLAKLRSRDGKCDEVGELSRRMLGLVPDSDDAYQVLAGALLGMGEPLEAVRSALEQKWQRLPPEYLPAVRAEDRASLDILAGDFPSALAHYVELDAALAADPREIHHYRVAYQRMLVDLEQGRTAEVLTTAHDFLRRRSAWAASGFDVEPAMNVYALEFAAGGLSPSELGQERDRWLARQRSSGIAYDAGYLWAIAYAEPAQSPEDAARALAALPSAHPLLDARTSERGTAPDMAEPIGRTYLLGGRLDDAIPLLREAAGSCYGVRRFQPIFTTWAAFELGTALEARGDRGGACEAYARVLERWGTAPLSVTAARARTRAHILRCSAGLATSGDP